MENLSFGNYQNFYFKYSPGELNTEQIPEGKVNFKSLVFVDNSRKSVKKNQ